jgi:hypothetical protein
VWGREWRVGSVECGFGACPGTMERVEPRSKRDEPGQVTTFDNKSRESIVNNLDVTPLKLLHRGRTLRLLRS